MFVLKLSGVQNSMSFTKILLQNNIDKIFFIFETKKMILIIILSTEAQKNDRHDIYNNLDYFKNSHIK